jgi:hypothetical protein
MTIQTPLGIEACRERLKEATSPDSLKSIFVSSGTILCSFSGNRFRLRQKKAYNNSFEPLFYGVLTPQTGGTEISGDFRMRPFVIAFMALWFGMLVIIGGVMVAQNLRHLISGQSSAGANRVLGIVGPLVMAAFGVGLVAFGQWLGNSQKTEMTRFLQETFSPSALAASAVPALRKSAKIDMTKPILIFAGVGLMSVIFALAGVANFHAMTSNGASSLEVTPLVGYSSRSLTFGQGVFMLFLAYGTWKRLYVAWGLGFVLILLSAVSFVQGVGVQTTWMQPHNRTPMPVEIFMAIGGLAVGTYWATWWYKKKDYFCE